MTTVPERLAAARRDLLDLGTRNPLIHHRPSKVRGVRVVDEIPAEVWRLLVIEEKALSFTPSKAGSDEDAADVPLPATPASRHQDKVLQTAHPATALQTRLLATARDARLAVEEMGVTICYLALGFLGWREVDAKPADPERRAPLLLIPVTLVRADAASRFTVEWNGDEIGENLSLMAKLKSEFSIDLPKLPAAEDLDVTAWFAQVARAVAGQPGWRVDPSIALDFFSFARYLMYRDLDPANWPAEAGPDAHPVVRGVFGGGFPAPPPPRAGAPVEVVESDGTQREAVSAVGGGRSLVIQGPPGTGKSQTITNLIAQAIADGKTVLFVAEKLAALEVVKRRLDAVGLGDACLELHSDKASRKAVAAELKRTLALGRVQEPDGDAPERQLAEVAAQLDGHHQALQTAHGVTGLSPLAAIIILLRQRSDGAETWPPLDLPVLAATAVEETGRWRDSAAELQAIIARVGALQRLSFAGAGRDTLLPSDEAAISAAIAAAARAYSPAWQAAQALATALAAPAPTRLADATALISAADRRRTAPTGALPIAGNAAWERRAEADRLLAAGSALQALKARHQATFIPEAWDADVLDLRGVIVAEGSSFFNFLSSSWRAAKAKLGALLRVPVPGKGAECLLLVDALLDGRRQAEAIRTQEALGRALFADAWNGPASDWNHLAAIADWVRGWRAAVADGKLPAGLPADGPAPDPTPARSALATFDATWKPLADVLRWNAQPLATLPDAAERLAAWTTLAPLHDTVAVNRGAAKLAALPALTTLAASWEFAGTRLVDVFDRARAQAVLAAAAAERPALAGFDVATHERLQQRFAELDRQVLTRTRARLASAHWRRIPGPAALGQVGLVRREAEKKARHLALRTLLRDAGRAIQAMKPVMMMSPISVAAHLDPAGLRFDLVVFDEASQVRPVDAIGCLARARQAVVVGDSRQMPPTAFFDRLVSADEDEPADGMSQTRDLESLLALMEAGGAPVQWLRWHYRSRHPSLIATSNRAVYDGRLLVFPSPQTSGSADGDGLSLRRIAGVYDRAKTRTNAIEAAAVADAVIAHATATPQFSLGVCAFSQAQAQAVTLAVEKARRAAPAAEAFFAAHEHEPFFVKNLENVQGDERDTMLVSVGYGKDAAGAVALNFGPLNNDGGERRLNVLITRARRRMVVFTNLAAEDIDLTRTQAKGLALLREFLVAAAKGGESIIAADGARDAFADAVTRLLPPPATAEAVGAGGLALRIAADGKLLGGLSDGGAVTGTTRDRERLRGEVLAGLGWRLYRLWAAAWWRRTDDERQRLLAAIAAPAVAVAKPPAPTRIERNNDAPPAGLPPLPAYRVVLPAIAVEERSLVGMSALRLAGWVSEIVAGEGPVHPDTVCARLAEAASGRASDQQALDASLRAGISEAVRSGAVRDDGGFLWAKGQDQAIPRDRSERPIDERRLARIAPAELAAAIARAVAECHGIAEADAGPSAIRVLGLGKAAGGDEAVWAEATALALRDQTISRTADRLEPAV